jgi:hypothetical protein
MSGGQSEKRPYELHGRTTPAWPVNALSSW